MNSNVIEQNQVKAQPRPTGVNFQAPNQEDLIELIGNWEWLAIMAMVDGSDGQVDANLVAVRLGMTKERAADTLAAMMSHNILHKTEDGKLVSFEKNVVMNEKDFPMSDMLNAFVKTKLHLAGRLNSKDLFAVAFITASKSVLESKHKEIFKIKDEIEKLSIGKSDVEIYALDYAFTRLTKTRSELL